jgi:pyridoxal phosphate enzyme (YggS family)
LAFSSAVGSEIAGRIASVRGRIERAAERAGRPDQIALVAVSKSVPIDRVLEAYEAGQTVFGENRVQEGASKAAELPDAVWHLIGHLQSNKVRAAADAFALIESIDSLRVARKLDAAATSRSRRLPVLLEVNFAGEASKHGFGKEDCATAISAIAGLSGLHVRGLMTVAPLVTDPEDVRWVFRGLRVLRDRIASSGSLEGFDQLSMGMTNDYEVAIQEGATMVRIGRAIFGDRPAGGAA